MHYTGDRVHARIHRIGKSESNRSLCFLKAKMFICMAQTGGIIINDAGFTAKKEEEEKKVSWRSQTRPDCFDRLKELDKRYHPLRVDTFLIMSVDVCNSSL